MEFNIYRTLWKRINEIKEKNKLLKKADLKGVKRDDKKTREIIKQKYIDKNNYEIKIIKKWM